MIDSSDVLRAFEKNKREPGMRLDLKSCRISRTRTRCGMSNGDFTFQGQKIPVFVKYSPCQWDLFNDPRKRECWPMSDDTARESPGYAETKMFAMTNAFRELDIVDTILDIVRTRPELSQLAEALSDLPRLRRALDRVDRDGDTFFAPTNAAIDALLAWGGFVEKAEVRRPSASGVARRPGPDDDSRTPRRRHQLSDAAPKSREDFFFR